jgi:hypothetical protein
VPVRRGRRPPGGRPRGLHGHRARGARSGKRRCGGRYLPRRRGAQPAHPPHRLARLHRRWKAHGGRLRRQRLQSGRLLPSVVPPQLRRRRPQG